MVATPAQTVPFLAVVFALTCFVSLMALGLMFVVTILNDAGAIDWTLSYRQCQIISLICTVSRSIWAYVYDRK